MKDCEAPRRSLRNDAERNRQKVLVAARELFALRGLDATLNDIAHHAGLGVGTVYRRFPSKEVLLETIFDDCINELAGLAETALLENDPWFGFTWFVMRMGEVTAKDRGLREVLLSKAYGGQRICAGRVRLQTSVSALVQRAQNDGHLRPDVSPTDLPVIALVAGAVSEFAGQIGPDLWRRFVDLIISGMRYSACREPLVGALSGGELEAAMETWMPAGPA